MNFKIPDGHYLVSYDYGMGGLWWFVKASSPKAIRKASTDLTVFDEVPEWMLAEDWGLIETDDLLDPRSDALRMILAGQN